MMKRLLLILLLTLLLLPFNLQADWTLEGIPLSTRDESVLAVIQGTGGTSWIAWNDNPVDSETARVCVQRYGVQGNTLFEGHGFYLESDPSVTSDLLGAVRSGRDNLLVVYSLTGDGVTDGIYVQLVTSTGLTEFEERHLVAATDVGVGAFQGNYQVVSDRAGGAWCMYSNSDAAVIRLVGVNVDGSPKTDAPVLVCEGEFPTGQNRLAEKDDHGVWVGYVDLVDEFAVFLEYNEAGELEPTDLACEPGPFTGWLRMVDSGFGGFYATIDNPSYPITFWYSPDLQYFLPARDIIGDRFGVRSITPHDIDGVVSLGYANVFNDTTVGVYNYEVSYSMHGWSGIGSGVAVYDTSEWSGLYEMVSYASVDDRFTVTLQETVDEPGGSVTLLPVIRRHAVDSDFRTHFRWQHELVDNTWTMEDLPVFPETWCWMLENDCVLMLLPQGGVGNVRDYRLIHINPEGDVSNNQSDLADGVGHPVEFELLPAYPNPFNATSLIRYDLPVSQEVTVQVFDVLGRQVAELVSGRQPAGFHSVVFDGSHLSSGVYFYQLSSPHYHAVKKMVMVK